MSRTLLILGEFALIASSILAQQRLDPASTLLRGPVKSISSTFIEHLGEQPDQKPPVRNGGAVTYDRAGFEIERSVANDSGQIVDKEVHRYDGAGKRTSTKHFNAAGRWWATEVFRYTDGRLTEKLAYDAAKVLSMHTTYRYDPDGRLIEEAYRDPTVLRGRTLYAYTGSSADPSITKFLTDKDEKEIAPLGPCRGFHRIAFTYDTDHRIVTKVLFDQRDKEQERFTYVYAPSGVYRKITRKMPRQEVVHTYEYRFDSHGNWIEEAITRQWDAFISPRDRSFESSAQVSAGVRGSNLGELKMLEKLRTVKTVTTRQIEYH